MNFTRKVHLIKWIYLQSVK